MDHHHPGDPPDSRKCPARDHRAFPQNHSTQQHRQYSNITAKIQSVSTTAGRLDRLADALLAGGLHRAAEAISLRAAALRGVVA